MKVEEIAEAVARLPPDQLARFRRWFIAFEQAAPITPRNSTQDPIIEAPSPARIRASRVTFEPGAQTAWHTHPRGQTLHVPSGAGRIQAWGGPIREITPGDTVWIPPGKKHWHGAGPTTAMVHIALQEALDGAHVVWLEKFSDEQ